VDNGARSHYSARALRPKLWACGGDARLSVRRVTAIPHAHTAAAVEAASHTSSRAPALYFAAPTASLSSQAPVTFRIPCPPAWDDRQPSVWAAERRARKAYLAALEALVTGSVAGEQADKLQRLAREIRSSSARASLEHLGRVMSFVRRHGRPVLASPAEPLTTVIATVPLPPQGAGEEGLRRRYAWAIEWLQSRRFLARRGLEIRWQVEVPAAPVARRAAACDTPPRGGRGAARRPVGGPAHGAASVGG
jgi:hypothetical protein